jgi:hypothetical protein
MHLNLRSGYCHEAAISDDTPIDIYVIYLQHFYFNEIANI